MPANCTKVAKDLLDAYITMKMTFDSIKSRLVLMTLICVLGMGTLVVSQHMVNVQLLALSEQKDLLHKLSLDLLQLRRHEKDFLLRRNVRYVNQFNERLEQFNTYLARIEPLFSDYGLDDSKPEELALTIKRYDELFKQVVYIYRVIGLTTSQGLRGEFTAVMQRLNAQANSDFALRQLANAKAAQTEFLINFDMQSVSEFKQATDELSVANFTSSSSAEDLATLTGLFVSLSDSVQQLGETETEGLRGNFRRQAHLLESQLANVEQQLQPIIQRQGERVRMYNLLIAVATCVTMIVILIKSFATFHRAFAYFVMFFYQCKREFQRIDPKKLGFAEFKSLAELANEMVEARKDAELKLEEVKRQLTEREGI